MTNTKLWELSMFTQSLNCLESRYLLFFSLRGVSRYTGTDVKFKNIDFPAEADFACYCIILKTVF